MPIPAEDLCAKIMDELHNYHEEVTEDMKKEVKKVTKQCQKEIQANSPARPGGGSYKAGWTSTKVYENSTEIVMEVHNKTDYQLAHLLEDGHAKVNGGFVKGHPHIGPAADRAADALEKAVIYKVKK